MAPTRLDLLCLPCAGASAVMYLRWRRLAPAWLNIVPVELPGRGARGDEALVADHDTLRDQLADELAARPTGAPYALFGHSMGALLAHGLCHALPARGAEAPRALFASASPAPSRRDAVRLPDPDDADALVRELRRQGGTDEAVFAHDELLAMTLRTLAADYRVCRSHVHRTTPPLALPVHVLAGRDDPIGADRLAAWRETTRGPCTVDWFDGGHFFIRPAEHAVLDTVAHRLSAVPAALSA